MAAPQHNMTHRTTGGMFAREDGACAPFGRFVELDEVDADLTVQQDHELIVRAGEPR